MNGVATLMRIIHVAACLSLGGVLSFHLLVLTPVLREIGEAGECLRRPLARLAIASAIFAVVACATWLPLEAVVLTSAANLGEALRGAGVIAWHTRFGRIFVAHCALLGVAAACMTPPVLGSAMRHRVAAIAALSSFVLLAAMEHAASAGGTGAAGLLAAQCLHLLAACLWVGALAPLLMCTTQLPAEDLARVARRFSPLGIACVGTLALSGVWNGAALCGGVPGLVGTAYGRLLLGKFALFSVMLALATANRRRFTPTLERDAGAVRKLRRSVLAELLAGAGAVSVAVVLAGTPPGAQVEPIWPFAFRLPWSNGELASSLALAGLGVLLVVAAQSLDARDRRWSLRLGGLCMTVPFVAEFWLLSIPAYPTTFWRSPTGFSANGIATGAGLFAAHCASCHGERGRGDGPAAARLPVEPTDLTAPDLWPHTDGDLYWWISNGMAGGVMPAFRRQIDERGRWALIDFLRANAAGQEGWRRPLLAPDFFVNCPAQSTERVRDLRGRPVLLMLAGGPVTVAAATALSQDAALRATGMRVVLIGTKPGAPDCSAHGRALMRAYAVTAGWPPSEVSGAAFLVDRGSWLRKKWRRDEASAWRSDAALLRAIRYVEANALAAPPRGRHVH